MLLKKLTVLLLCLLVSVLTACSNTTSTPTPSKENKTAGNETTKPETNSPAKTDKKFVIGGSVPSLEFTFFVAAKKAWEESASQLGVDAPFYNAENNQAKQNKDIEDMIVKKVDAIVVVPITTEGIVPAIKAANEAGIPVFTVDRSVSSDSAKVVAHIGTNHEEMGEKAANLFLKGLEAKYPNEKVWNVAELQGTPGSSAAIERGKGIHKVLESNPKVKIVASLDGEFQSTTAMRVTEDILTANSSLQGIISHNDMMIEGALQAAKDASRDKQLVMVGMDGQKSTVEKIKSGEIFGTLIQYPSMFGDGMKAAVKYLKKEQVDPKVWVPTDLIDKANADEMLKSKAW